VNYFGQGYERLEDGRMDYFIQQSTAYSDIMIDVLQSADPPEPTATSPTDTQDLESMIQHAIDNPELFPDPFPEDSDDENEDSDNESTTGDVGIHGLEYLQGEELDDAPEIQHSRATDDPESESSDDEGEQASENEEEQMDRDFIVEEDEYSTDEEQR
jgi:hypothetical protein